ncbi:hypothetical protein HDU87_000123 [Geranomyces variabilis]|uniref:Uncharacterized protein n=1 Tax=Geranomyces variabilis TaxID=109894 RepID=A0AAD5XR38_9FUNG|nr:hypothetical protein HDU87_000123 [Geranomyces variabilis]
MDELLKALLTNAANNPNPETLASALAVADRIRASNESQERLKAIELENLQEQNRAAALRVKEQELSLQFAIGSTSSSGPTSSSSSVIYPVSDAAASSTNPRGSQPGGRLNMCDMDAQSNYLSLQPLQQQQQQYVADPSSKWFDGTSSSALTSRPEDPTRLPLPHQYHQHSLLDTSRSMQPLTGSMPPYLPSQYPPVCNGHSENPPVLSQGPGAQPGLTFLGPPQMPGLWPNDVQQQQQQQQQSSVDGGAMATSMGVGVGTQPYYYGADPNASFRSQQPYAQPPPALPVQPQPPQQQQQQQHPQPSLHSTRSNTLQHQHRHHTIQTGSRLIGRRGRSTAPIDWNPANHLWTNSHGALLTFGMEDFGHGQSMPHFASFLDAVERTPMGNPPQHDQNHPKIPVYYGEQPNTPYTNNAQSRAPQQLITDDAESRRLSSQFSGSDIPDSDSPLSANVGPNPPGGGGAPTSSAPRKKKQVMEEDGFCRKCGTQIAIFLLHGEEAALQMQHEIDVLCMRCASEEDPSTDPSDTGAPAIATANLVPGSRKRTGPSRRAERAACDVCKRVVAVGSVRLTGDSKDRDRDMEPDFEAEIICVSCRAKYALCTECGGGGRYRTGKWRPLGLFQPGRRTCKLPHVRIGATPVLFAEWLVPDMLDADVTKRSTILNDIEKAVPSMYYHRLAVPEVMELAPPNDLATFEMLEARVAARCKYLRDFVLDPSIERRHNVRRYFGAAWIDRVSRHKKEKKRPTPTPSQPEQQWTEGHAAVDEHGEAKAPGSQSMMVAMISVWWDIRSGCLRLSALQALNTEFTSGSVLFRLTRHVLERIVQDREDFIQNHQGDPPPPIEILGLPVFEEFARLPGVQQTLERLAFSHLNDYEKAHPELDRATVERGLIDVGDLFGGKPKYSRSFYVGSVSGILAGPWGLQAVAKRRKKGVKGTVPVSAEA